MIPEWFTDFSDPKSAVLNESLAKLGDPLVNLIYSLARSKARGEPDGDKAPNKVLSEALSGAGLRDLASSRVDRHRLGDVAEAIIAFAWLQDEIEIKEAADILASSLVDADFESRKEVFRAAEEGFEGLLSVISERVSFE